MPVSPVRRGVRRRWTSKPPLGPRRAGKLRHLTEADPLDLLDDQLGNPVEALEPHGLARIEIHHDHLDLPTVPGINRPRGITRATPQRAARPDRGCTKAAYPLGQGHRHPGGQHRAFTGRAVSAGLGGAQVRLRRHPGARTPEAVRPGRRVGAGLESRASTGPRRHGFTSKARARRTWSGSAIAAWISSVAAVVDEVVDLDLDEQRVGADRDGARPGRRSGRWRCSRSSGRATAVTSGRRGTASVPTGTGRTEVGLQPCRSPRSMRSSQFSEPSVSSSAVASTPPWARPGAPWWAGCTVNSAVIAHALRRPRASRCSPCGLSRRRSRNTGRSGRRGVRRVRARPGAGPASTASAGGLESWKYHSQAQTLPAQRRCRSAAVPSLDSWCHAASPPPPYEERLTAPRSWWLISFLVGDRRWRLMLLPFGTLPMLGGARSAAPPSAALAVSQFLRLGAHPGGGRQP
ncbi:hypothetical protein SGRIM128S_07112 [Streptomyces griseomycini]